MNKDEFSLVRIRKEIHSELKIRSAQQGKKLYEVIEDLVKGN